MQQNDDSGMLPDPPPNNSGSGQKVVGILLIILGLVGGGFWTMLMSLGEGFAMGNGRGANVPLGTILTATATVLLIAAGSCLIAASNRARINLFQTAKSLASTAVFLIALAAAGYVFGFVVCLAGK